MQQKSKKKSFKDVKKVEPADYFLDHLQNKYPAPPETLRGYPLNDIWFSLSFIEQRFIHHFHRAYPTWKAISKDWVERDVVSLSSMAPLQRWVVEEEPDFDVFLTNLDTRFAKKEIILEGINTIYASWGEPLYINAFEAACYFFLLARHCITKDNEYPYYNAMMKTYECFGQFRGWVEIARNESQLLDRKENSSKGGKQTAKNGGAELIRNELIRVLKERVANGEQSCSKKELASIASKDVYDFIEKNKEIISERSQVESAEELASRIEDWAKRNAEPYQEIYALFKSLVTPK